MTYRCKHGRSSQITVRGACGGKATTVLGQKMAVERGIIHIDMDAFYASVEQRDDPGLRGRPVAVGGRDGRGVVMTASYEARISGVRSAMPAGEAFRRCPELVFVPPRFDAYKEASRQIREIFRRFTSLIEPLSLDEAYLDVSHQPIGPMAVAATIKAMIASETGLTASAGVSFNKFLAKTASGLNKPDGLTQVAASDAAALLARLPIEGFHGIGPRTAEKLRGVGITSGADLARTSEIWLVRRFGKSGAWLARVAKGEDERPVEADRPRRSVSAEQTFARDLVGRTALLPPLHALAVDLHQRLKDTGFRGRSLVLKIRTGDFVTKTRTVTPRVFPQDVETLWTLAVGLLDRPEPPRGSVRLLGLGVNDGGDERDRRQLDLFQTKR